MLGVVISAVIAIAYYFVWPGWKDPQLVRQRSLSSKIILRWFHPLTWGCLPQLAFFE
jgi:hypothetical protein